MFIGHCRRFQVADFGWIEEYKMLTSTALSIGLATVRALPIRQLDGAILFVLIFLFLVLWCFGATKSSHLDLLILPKFMLLFGLQEQNLISFSLCCDDPSHLALCLPSKWSMASERVRSPKWVLMPVSRVGAWHGEWREISFPVSQQQQNNTGPIPQK